MNYIQTFDGTVKAKGVATDTLFYSSIATDGLVIVDGAVTQYNGTAKEVYIPDYYNGTLVTTIGVNAFANNTNIVSVRFPKHLTTIAGEAFYGCTGLVSVELGDIDLDISPNIASGAFGGCTSLQAVTINAVYLGDIASGAFGIASGQVCALYRPTSVEDERDWETIANRENLRLSVKYSTKKAWDSVKAEQDGNGSNIAENYAKKNGTYANMTVGNATNASKATTTDFTNKAWNTATNNSQIFTAGTWQLYYTYQLDGSVNASFGLIYFDGQNASTAHTTIKVSESGTPVDLYLYITANGGVRVYGATGGTTNTLDLSNLHYREIR